MRNTAYYFYTGAGLVLCIDTQSPGICIGIGTEKGRIPNEIPTENYPSMLYGAVQYLSAHCFGLTARSVSVFLSTCI